MRPIASLGMVLGLLAAPAWGQDVKPAVQGNGGVHRLEVSDGSTRRVHYFPSDKSSGEAQTWRDLERAEDEAAYVENLHALRRLYVANERKLEIVRNAMQTTYYGRTVNLAYGGVYDATAYAYPNARPYAYSNYGASTFGVAAKTISEGVENGIGPEGVLKTEMARVIARQATPEYTVTVNRQLSEALAAMPREGKPGGERPVEFERKAPPRNVAVKIKGDDKLLEGQLIREDAEWLVVKTAAGEERVRMSEVVRISTKNDGK